MAPTVFRLFSWGVSLPTKQGVKKGTNHWGTEKPCTAQCPSRRPHCQFRGSFGCGSKSRHPKWISLSGSKGWKPKPAETPIRSFNFERATPKSATNILGLHAPTLSSPGSPEKRNVHVHLTVRGCAKRKNAVWVWNPKRGSQHVPSKVLQCTGGFNVHGNCHFWRFQKGTWRKIRLLGNGTHQRQGPTFEVEEGARADRPLL